MVALAALLVHAPSAANAFYTHDCWNAAQVGERVLNGTLGHWENVQRILVVMSFGLRSHFGLSPLAWHLPNLLGHAVNAVLVTLLARRFGGRLAGLAAGVLFGVQALLAHPVEWVGGGYDVFATLGILGAGLLTLSGRPLAAALSAVVALFSKEVGVVVAPIVALLWVLDRGWPRERAAWRALARAIALPLALTLVVLSVRVWQVQYGPNDNLAGRTIGLNLIETLSTAPVALGVAVLGPWSDALDLDQPENAVPAAWIALAVVAALMVIWRRTRLIPAAGLLGAGLLALGPVSLLGLDRAELLANTRYLYLTAALVAPVLPILLFSNGVLRRTRLGLFLPLAALAAWGGVDRVLHFVGPTRGVAPLIAAVDGLAPGSSLVVLSTFYDDPSARFLMSEFLLQNRGIRARYVMRGTGVVFARRPHVGSDAALAYFGPHPQPFDPDRLAPGEQVWLHTLSDASVEPVTLPVRTSPADAAELAVAFVALPPADPEDPPTKIIQGRQLASERRVGPVASAVLGPEAACPIGDDPRPLQRLELTVTVRSDARAEYTSGYHDRWTAVFLGPPFDERHAFSAEVLATGERQTLRFDLSWDPILHDTRPESVGLLPLNQPGSVTIERLQVAR